MIILQTTTDILEVLLGGAITTNQLACVSSWRDITTTGYTPGRTVIATNGATAVSAVEAPSSLTQRLIDLINIENADTVAQTVTVRYNLNGSFYKIYQVVLQPNETAQFTNKGGWTHSSAQGATLSTNSGGPSDVQVFNTHGSFTWTKPTIFTPKFCQVICIGAGGGGGSGQGATSGATYDGGGGGGGAYNMRWFRASDLGATESVTIGQGGAGATGNGPGLSGSTASAGTNTTFGTTVRLTAGGGGGGGGGDNSSRTSGGGGGGTGGAGANGSTTSTQGTGGLPGTSTTGQIAGAGSAQGFGASAEYGGGGGGSASSVGGSCIYGGGGGGPGAVSGKNDGWAGGPAGIFPGAAGGAGSAGAAGTDGKNGRSGDSCHGGGGGGGGGSTSAVALGGNGGNGGAAGGGGGGGGAGGNGGGNGGTGGDGYACIVSW